jgi:SecD/SecF fusion protein
MRTPKWKIYLYLAVIIFGALAALPNVLGKERAAAMMPSWLPNKPVSLGLDLRGGAQLVLEVDSRALLKEKVELLQTDTRSALREAKVIVKTVRVTGDKVVVTPNEKTDKAALMKELNRMNASAGVAAFGTSAPELMVVTKDNGDIEMSLTEAGIAARVTAAVDQSLEIVRSRIDEIGVAEPVIQKVGSDRIVVQLPGVQNSGPILEMIGTTAKMTFHLMAEPGSAGKLTLPDADGNGMTYDVKAQPALTGEHLVDAQAQLDPRTGQPVVHFRFDGVGARQFGRITSENVHKPFAIVLDGKVLSAPVINEPITGGSGTISGNFTMEETATLSALLRAGALPAPLTVIEERTVGPDLGSDAIKMGLETGLIGFLLVVGFIAFLYGPWGMIANLALAFNVVLLMGALGIIGATLTLPGIAGIILGLGLAVDANILINERIREEAAKGKSAIAALDAGFKKAYATIIDSHATGFIATLLLFQFGTGPVKGFAVTMALGIIISLFTAVAVVRVVMTEIVVRRKMKTLHIKAPFGIGDRQTKIKFMNGWRVGFAVSAFLSISSIVLFFNPGLNYGVDFKGGIQIEVATAEKADMAALRHELHALGLGEIGLQEAGGTSKPTVMVRAERQPGGEEEQTAAVTKIKETISKVDSTATFERTEVVGPKVSGELATSGILAVVFASICMLFYIWWRFEWPFAVGAIVTLILDVTKTVGFFALTGLDFNLTAIAALLTLVGYTVNDKVVVYDRIRENMRAYKKMPFRDLIDMSINQSITRCIYTTVTTLLAMLPMAIWGGSAVSSFAVPMVFGIIVAGSSSIFIAAPILMFLGDWRTKHREKLEAEGRLHEDEAEAMP